MRLTGRPGAWLRSRWWRRLACIALLAGFATALIAAEADRPARADTPNTVVSLTFDDGNADQVTAASIMHKYGLDGTFYIITSAVGNRTYMTMSDLRTLAADGDEIGDHTVSHLNLPKVSLAEARRQICGGRNILAGWGFQVTSFAYPDSFHNSAVERVARECGLNSSRGGNGINNGICQGCAAAETIPPANPYAVRTPGLVDTSWQVQDLEQVVTNAEENGGGWIPFVFHHICTDPNGSSCGDLSITPAHFTEFVSWLARNQEHGARVETVNRVVGGPVHPEVRAPAASPHGVQNSSMTAFGSSVSVSTATESTNDVTGPRCWMYGGYGQNSVRWQRIPGGHDTPYAEQATMTSRTSGDAKLLQQFDTGQCSLPVKPGQAYQLTSWYQGTIRTQYAVYYRLASGRWVYWTSSPYFAASGSWARAQWQTPPLPSGATGLSFGLDLESAGTLTTSDYSFQKAPIKAGVLAFRIIVLVAAGALVARVLYTRRAPFGRAVTRVWLAGPGRRGRPVPDRPEREPVAAMSATATRRGARPGEGQGAGDRGGPGGPGGGA